MEEGRSKERITLSYIFKERRDGAPQGTGFDDYRWNGMNCHPVPAVIVILVRPFTDKIQILYSTGQPIGATCIPVQH